MNATSETCNCGHNMELFIFSQLILSPSVTISNKNNICDLPQVLPNTLKFRTLEFLERSTKYPLKSGLAVDQKVFRLFITHHIYLLFCSENIHIAHRFI